MAVPPIVALKAAGTTQGALQKALTGDIYTKTWSEVVGRGKKAKIVEKTVHVNPVGIGLGALAVGAAATAAVGALWLAQLKLTPVRHPQYHTVVDTPAEPQKWVVTREGGTEPMWIRSSKIVTIYPQTGGMTAEELREAGVPKPWGMSAQAEVDTSHWGTHSWAEEGYVVPAVAEVSHQEPTGKSVLRFTIEQRQGFSIADILPAPIREFKESAEAVPKITSKLIMDPWHVFKGKWF